MKGQIRSKRNRLSNPGHRVRRYDDGPDPPGEPGRRRPMRYLLMIYADQATMPQSEAELGAMWAEYGSFGRWLEETGQFLGGEALQPISTATTVAVRDGHRILTDGPFAETKEQLGGYYLINAADLDAAIEAAARIPGARTGRVEIRPIMEMG